MFMEVRKDCYRLLGEIGYLDGLEAACVLKKAKKEKKTTRLGGESFTWSVFETN